MLASKRGLGGLVLAGILAGSLVPASAEAATIKPQEWELIKYYHPGDAANGAKCRSDGEYYADGSTGYRCDWYPNSYPPHQGQSHWELWVGP